MSEPLAMAALAVGCALVALLTMRLVALFFLVRNAYAEARRIGPEDHESKHV